MGKHHERVGCCRPRVTRYGRAGGGPVSDNADHPRASELFDPQRLPAFHDPFAGGGALPLEAQRLGLESHASDLNPVAVLINKAMIEIPSKFAARPPVNPVTRSGRGLLSREWTAARGLADDVRYYARWMRDEAARRIGRLYPKIAVTDEMVRERWDLKPYAGHCLNVIAWLWARTVKSPNPAFTDVDVPLASTFMLSTKKGKEAYVEPVVEGAGYRFTVKVGAPSDAAAVKAGTKLSRGANFRCVMSGAPIAADYIKAEGMAGRISARLMAIVAEGERGRVYLPPTLEHEAIAHEVMPAWRPDVEFFRHALGFRVGSYGMKNWSDLFTCRQLVALDTFSDLVTEAGGRVRQDAIAGGFLDDGSPLHAAGTGATAYAEAVVVYLAFAVSKAADRNTSLCVWEQKMDRLRGTFSRQALPMTWDYTETNPFSGAGGDIYGTAQSLCEVLDKLGTGVAGAGVQDDAARQHRALPAVVSTDPPYYDNIGYADLSDFFYVWLRRSLKPVFPKLFATLSVPKADELVATPYRHGNKAKAEAFFMNGMTQAMKRLAWQAYPGFPTTIYYAFKQTEGRDDRGVASTGWETFLEAVISAGFTISGTWPMRTELGNRMRGMGSNALASSVVLVCRKRSKDSAIATRRDFMAALKAELPSALAYLQRGNIAPVDLAQAAIGPGMAVYTRYAKVVGATGNRVSVGEALALVNHTLDEILAEQEGDFDADSRWALVWFDHHGFSAGDYGIAETLSKAKNTSVSGMVDAGILHSRAGNVRLLRPHELPSDWDPAGDDRLTAWETVHHLIRVLEQGGESAAADLVRKLGGFGEVARDLCYRLYTVCERSKWAVEALAYNGLVKSWPEINRLASTEVHPEQVSLFDRDGTIVSV